MKVYIVVRHYCDNWVEGVNTLKIFENAAAAYSYAFTLNLENSCESANFTVQEWDVE